MELPREYQNVFITYVDDVIVRDKYYDHFEKQTVTRRAFYSNSSGYYNSKDEWISTPDGYFCVPKYWRDWTFSDGTVALLPHTFESYRRVLPEEIIKWELDEK